MPEKMKIFFSGFQLTEAILEFERRVEMDAMVTFWDMHKKAIPSDRLTHLILRNRKYQQKKRKKKKGKK